MGQADSEEMARTLAKRCGAFVGVSAAGATVAALRVCAELDAGVAVVILCDRGDRYLSSNLFARKEA